jgi:hypothetical protein
MNGKIFAEKHLFSATVFQKTAYAPLEGYIYSIHIYLHSFMQRHVLMRKRRVLQTSFKERIRQGNLKFTPSLHRTWRREHQWLCEIN